MAEILIKSFSVTERPGVLARGLFVSDRSVYEALKDHLNVLFAGEALPERRIVFDGTQRKRYTLKVTG